ncbi:PASTA domain-containing protein [Goodfellowiella coeruleoviolacea]|uniref:PASTA domain-containing protein n=1 Tax=Goodfellowiella coeruleoviolacea TaxID=334858 RepID=UPI0020A4E55C|nr:PASTA domain-containing protein [Goodfellowiella coeruleoviolacea]
MEVPDLVGLGVRVARQVGHDTGLVVTSADLDGPPLGALTWPGTWVVTDQRPAPGQLVTRGTVVTISFQEQPPDNGSGDREPRRPLPRPDTASASRGVDEDPQ